MLSFALGRSEVRFRQKQSRSGMTQVNIDNGNTRFVEQDLAGPLRP